MFVTIRRPLLLLLGLAVAAIVLMAATQLLLLSFETDPLLSRTWLDDITGWIRRPPRPGVAILAGLALAVASLGLIWSMVRSRSTDRRVMTTRRRAGWTKIDRPTLEDAIERHLEFIDRRNDIRANVDRNGKVDLKIITPDPSAMGPVQELRDALDDFCEQRSLPCRSGRITATTPRRTTSRRRVR